MARLPQILYFVYNYNYSQSTGFKTNHPVLLCVEVIDYVEAIDPLQIEDIMAGLPQILYFDYTAADQRKSPGIVVRWCQLKLLTIPG